jgi:hypothetical protein
MPQGNEKKQSDNLWWEFYFVRYFVGTALGAIIILLLATSTSPVFTSQGALAEILKTLKPEKFEPSHLWLLATIGLAYCYLASSPVLVLHATRGSLLSVRTAAKQKSTLCFATIFFLIDGVIVRSLFIALRTKGSPWDMREFWFGAATLTFLSFVFVFQVFLLWLSLWNRESKAFDYYDELVKKRAQTTPESQEYVESYRHLREHGNAFLIAMLELLLGTVLYYSPIPWDSVLMLWVTPAAGVWFVATRLESRKF